MEEFDNYQILKTKKPALDISRFTIKEQEEHEFAHWVNLTAKLINRPYFATFRLVEKWPVEKIIRRYELSTKHAGDMPEAVKWWWLRKQEKDVRK